MTLARVLGARNEIANSITLLFLLRVNLHLQASCSSCLAALLLPFRISTGSEALASANIAQTTAYQRGPHIHTRVLPRAVDLHSILTPHPQVLARVLLLRAQRRMHRAVS